MLKRIAVLISGGGTNLQSVIDACEKNIVNAEVVGVISNKKKAYGLERARIHGIKDIYIGKGNYPDLISRSEALINEIKALNVDLIILAGYLAILDKNFFKNFEGRVLNIHPSLIPKYAGKGYYGMRVHEAVIKNKEEYSGATVHFVDEDIDTGQIVMQEAIKLSENETAESLQKRVLHIEHKILVSSIKKFIDGEL